MKKLKVYLIRHGKTEANEKHLYCGKTDISLSERGKKELYDIKSTVKYPECISFFSSGAKRANETLEILYPEKTYSEINEFWEYNFGDFEMKSYDMLKENKEYIDKADYLTKSKKVQFILFLKSPTLYNVVFKAYRKAKRI